MKKPTLIIFTGMPGTGKTTLSERLAQELGLPLLAKDALKEIMFDELGWSDSEWSARLVRTTFRIMDYGIEQQLRAGNNLIVESNFMPRLANKKFQTWQQKYDYSGIQVVCRTDLDILAERCHDRSLTNRHPGHLDKSSIAGHRQSLARRIENGEDQPLDLKSTVYIVDTTDFAAVDFGGLLAQFKERLAA